MAKKTVHFSDFIYGVHAVCETFAAKRRKFGVLYTTKKPIKQWNQIARLKPDYVPVQFVTRDALDSMAGGKEHQGVLLYVSPFVYRAKMFDPQKHPFILVLDQIQDVRNLGAIVRSAYCAGASGIMLCEKNSASLNPAAIKSSAGLAEHVQILKSPSTAAAVQMLDEAGYTLYSTVVEKAQEASQVAFKGPLAVLIGNEEKGVHKAIAQKTHRITLAQRRGDISYNASVAAGIILYSIGLQLGQI